MIINHTMLEILDEIRNIEPRRKVRRLDVSADEIGNRMIDYYYETTSLETRDLIHEFLQEAGFKWMKKLITRDTDPVDQFVGLSTLEEYIALAAANDPRGQWFRTA